MDFWVTVITSAAVGSIVSGLATLWGQWRERRSRREELAVRLSIECATKWAEFVHKSALATGHGASIMEPTVFLDTYYKRILGLLDKGELPEEARVLAEDYMRRRQPDIDASRKA
jgi:hypothetical protein